MISSPGVLPVGRTRAREGRWFLMLSSLAACFVLAFTAATLAGAPGPLLNTVFAMTVPFVAPLAWWAFVRAPAELRLLALFLAAAATLWLLGSLDWYYYFVREGNTVPAPAGPWEIAFAAAYALAVAGIYTATRRVVSLRGAVLDASVVVAAGIALGTALVGHGLENGVTTDSLVTVIRPLFGVVILTLIASAGLGKWQGLPLSLVLVAVGQVCLTIGALVYTYDAVNEQQLDLRWAELGLLPGAVISMLSAGAIILGIDRPVRLGRSEEIPGHGVGATAVLWGALCGLAVTVGVAFYAQQTGRESVLVVGLAASAWIGGAMALRAHGSIRDLERAYDRLDRAHVALERAKDELGEANEQLARTNIELRSMHAAFESLLMIADERTRGGMRELVEDAGEDLAQLLSSYFRYRDR